MRAHVVAVGDFAGAQPLRVRVQLVFPEICVDCGTVPAASRSRWRLHVSSHATGCGGRSCVVCAAARGVFVLRLGRFCPSVE